MSQYSLVKLVIKIPKKKMGTAFTVPTIKNDGENYFRKFDSCKSKKTLKAA